MGLSGNSDFVNGNQFTKNKRNIDIVVNEYNDKISCAWVQLYKYVIFWARMQFAG